MRLYIDCDETLVFWENPNEPYTGTYSINDELVDVLKKGIDIGEYDVTIWSAGGAAWAEYVNQILFEGYNLPSSGKHELYKNIPENSYAVDDRLFHDRFYLSRFQQVFLPKEFVQYAKENQEIFDDSKKIKSNNY